MYLTDHKKIIVPLFNEAQLFIANIFHLSGIFSPCSSHIILSSPVFGGLPCFFILIVVLS